MESSHHAGDSDASNGNGAARISDLLAEGQAAFERDAYQAAIDAWSRIFLIDADNEEARCRIEEARRLQEERARRVEEIFHDAVDRLEAGETWWARQGFEKVLALHPNHAAAREHLRRLDPADDGGMSVPAGTPSPPSGSRVAGETASTGPETRDPRPGAPAEDRPAQRPRSTQPRDFRPPSRRRIFGRAFLAIGGVVLLFAAAVGWLLYSQRQQLFPNARPADPTTTATAPAPIAGAERLYAGGEVAEAIEMLKRVPPESADYAEAQTLIAQWQNGRDPILESIDRDLERHAELLAEAQDAYDAGDPLAAHRLLEEAATIAPPTEEAVALEATVNERLAPVAKVLEMYRDGAWERALRRLWRIRERRPDDPIVERLLIDGYYNLAVRDLQRNAPGEALAKISEAVALGPEDPDLERLAAFARVYRQRPVDLRYRLFVKYLPLR